MLELTNLTPKSCSDLLAIHAHAPKTLVDPVKDCLPRCHQQRPRRVLRSDSAWFANKVKGGPLQCLMPKPAVDLLCRFGTQQAAVRLSLNQDVLLDDSSTTESVRLART